jgi:hypothetical protein
MPSPYPSLLGQANNPRRLVQINDGSNMDSSACPYQAVLEGILGRIPGYPRLPSLWGLRISRYPRGYASTLHLSGRNYTCTQSKLSKIMWIFAVYPPQLWAVVSDERIALQWVC